MPPRQDATPIGARLAPWARGAGLFLAYFTAGLIGLQLATVNSSASPVWPPTGIAIAGLILLGLRHWPAILLGAFLFNLNNTGDLPSSLLIAGGNTLEGLAGAWMTLKWFGGKRALHRVRDALGFAVGPGIVAPAISATVGVASLALTGLAPWSMFRTIWPTWWLGDVGGALVVAPVILAIAAGAHRRQRGQKREMSALLGATSLLGFFAFAYATLTPGPAMLAALGLLAVLAWAALRFGPREITLAVTAIAFFAVWGTIHGTGPLLRPSENESLLLVQVFVASLAVSTLVMGGAAAERVAAVGGPKHLRETRLPIVAVALGIVPLLLAALPVEALLTELEDTGQDAQRQSDADDLADAFGRTLDAHAVRLAGARAFFQTNDAVDRSQFRHYVEQSAWLRDSEDVRAVSFNRFVAGADLQAFEARVRNDADLDPALRATFEVFPVTQADLHVVVDYIEPFADNLGAWGFDIASNATRSATIAAAVETGAAVATPPVSLVQDDGQVYGILLVEAVYVDGGAQTVDQRRANAFGVLVTVHRIPDIAAAALAELGPSYTSRIVGLYDVGPASTSPPQTIPPDAPDLLLDPRATPGAPATSADHLVFPVTAAGRTWLVVLADDVSEPDVTQSSAPWFAMLVGGMLSTSFTLAAFAFESTTRRARNLAEALGQTMRKQKEAMEEAQAVAHLGSWHWDIRNDRIEWTDEMYRIFGVEGSDRTPTFQSYLAVIHPDDREAAERTIDQAMADHKPFSFEHRVVRSDGSEVLVMSRGRVEVDGQGKPIKMSGTAQDITELRVAENQFRLLLESAPDAMVVVDSAGQLVLVNGEAERMFGYTRKEMLGQPVEMLVPMKQRHGHEAHRDRYMEHAVRRPMGRGLELAGLRKDGSQVPVEISLSPLESTEGPRVIATVRDITDRRAAEVAAREAQERVQEVSRLRQIDRFKTEFINTAAHELRTPLMPLRAQVHMMQFNPNSPPDEFQRKALVVMHRNLERLGALVEDLLTVSHAQAGRLAIDPRPMELGELLDEACDGFRAVAQARDIDFVTPKSTPITIFADHNRISQVVSNLLSNAFKFTPPKGKIVVEMADEGGDAVVRITDDGVGISPEDLRRLFSAFVQVHDVAETSEPGSGLGLYICKQLVDMHGGTIGADSKGPGQGSSFWFRLPKDAPAAPTTLDLPTAKDDEAPPEDDA